MFSPGDAVAKVDGYIIQVVGGERHVGEKHLVRIDSAGRTSAVASLVEIGSSPAREPEPRSADDDSDDGLDSKPRRRGRRGGRRRSGAQAESAGAGTSSE
jgi:ribonuclease G